METIQTIEPRFTLRFATPDDAAQIVSFMKKLGAYQHMLEKTIVTEEAMRQLLSEKKGEALMGDYDGTPGAFIYFYPNSAAFTGRTGIYIDAFWVDDGLRGKGLGSIMMAFMSNLVIDRGGSRLEWVCLDWNTPTARFYQNLGADACDTMTTHRLGPDKLVALASQFKNQSLV